jgi:DNA repair protein RadC
MHNQNDKTYIADKRTNENKVLETAAEILACRYVRKGEFTSSQATREFLRFKLGGYEREVFSVMLLDSQHKLIDYREIFFGTINAASVYPREVVKLVLVENAAAVILSHNHPSGTLQPSQADIAITKRLRDALALVDVSVLDHVIIGDGTYSFAEQGLL